jgi:hypothetical protein
VPSLASVTVAGNEDPRLVTYDNTGDAEREIEKGIVLYTGGKVASVLHAGNAEYVRPKGATANVPSLLETVTE